MAAVVILGLAAVVAIPRAAAHDSLAPKGAAHNWLPKEGWVWMHWLPFEEPELERALGLDAAGLRRYLSDDTHVLATLARRRGLKARTLADRLTRRFDGRVTAKRLASLRWRTMRVLTQRHLAQHVLFHIFHGPGVPARAPAIPGVSRATFLADRQQGMTPAQIAETSGRDVLTVRAALVALLRSEAREGVASRSESAAQAHRMLHRQAVGVACWLTTPLPKLDPTNPYGGRDGDAGQAPDGAMPKAIPGCGAMHLGMEAD